MLVNFQTGPATDVTLGSAFRFDSSQAQLASGTDNEVEVRHRSRSSVTSVATVWKLTNIVSGSRARTCHSESVPWTWWPRLAGKVLTSVIRLVACHLLAPDQERVVCARRERLIWDSDRRAIDAESDRRLPETTGYSSTDNADRRVCQYVRTIDGGIDRSCVLRCLRHHECGPAYVYM